MTYYDQIYELAVNNHYLISTQEAADAGIPPVELPKLAQRGKLENIAHGLYRLTRHHPQQNDAYATAVARVGKNAFLFGESVIAMLELTPTNPAYICVATPNRTRRQLPPSIQLKKPVQGETHTYYDGIPSQSVANAIRSASETMMDDRLQEAAARAHQEGYLTKGEHMTLKQEMGWV